MVNKELIDEHKHSTGVVDRNRPEAMNDTLVNSTSITRDKANAQWNFVMACWLHAVEMCITQPS